MGPRRGLFDRADRIEAQVAPHVALARLSGGADLPLPRSPTPRALRWQPRPRSPADVPTAEEDREQVNQAFNDGKHPVRVLIGTDAAREGVNLQAQCADLFHFDLPWNPGRMERLDESTRLTWAEDTREEVLARLLELNRVMTAKEAEEAAAAETAKPAKKTAVKKQGPERRGDAGLTALARQELSRARGVNRLCRASPGE